MQYARILVIQTASLGDVILAQPVVQNLHRALPNAEIDVLVRAEAAPLLVNQPGLRDALSWEKRQGKYRHWWRLLRQIRARRYDLVVNLQRFTSTGLLTVFSAARETRGFDKNPWSRRFTKRFPHVIHTAAGGGPPLHEVDRNLGVIADLLPFPPERRPRLYPSEADYELVSDFRAESPYLVLAPGSAWFTKRWPAEYWGQLVAQLPHTHSVFVVGGTEDIPRGDWLTSFHPKVFNLAGRLTLLQSAALMDGAARVVCQDSSPLHLASSVNAPTTAIFCSTTPDFGFGPLADEATVVQASTPLPCKPCGIHGHRACPKIHFRCAHGISTEAVRTTVVSSGR